MNELRQRFGDKELHTINEELEPGDAVQIAGGALMGMQVIISRVVAGRDRIAVLMNLLGQQAIVEIERCLILGDGDKRTDLLRASSSLSVSRSTRLAK